MGLWVVFVLITSYGMSGYSLEVDDDLVNDVGSLQVQGYEVHEKLSDHSRERKPHLMIAVHQHSAADQGEESSSSSSSGEHKSSAIGTISVHQSPGGAGSGGSYEELLSHHSREGRPHLETKVLQHSPADQGESSSSAASSGEQKSPTAGTMIVYESSDEVASAGNYEQLLSHHTQEKRPNLDTTIFRYSSAGQESSSASVPEEQNSSAVGTSDAHQSTAEVAREGNYEIGKEIVKISDKKTYAHSTPENSVLSDSLKYYVGDDATFTHKPIILRSLTLSELDNGNRDQINLSKKRFNGVEGFPEALKNVEKKLSTNEPAVTKTKNNILPFRKMYNEIVRRPMQYGPQGETGLIVDHDLSAPSLEDGTREQSSYSPRTLTDQPTQIPVINDESFEVGTERNAHEVTVSSKSEENQDEHSFNGAPPYLQLTPSKNHVNIAEARSILTPHQQYILDQSNNPSFSGEFILNQNRFPYPFLPEQFGLENYNLRFPYPNHHGSRLNHVEHALRSAPQEGSNLVYGLDETVFGRGISNRNNFYTQPRAEDHGFSFVGFPFNGPHPSFGSYSREGIEGGQSDSFIRNFER